MSNEKLRSSLDGAVGSSEWFLTASDEEVLDLVYARYEDFADRINSISETLTEDQAAAHLVAPIATGDTRAFLVEPEVIGDFAPILGRTFMRFYQRGEDTGDFTNCLALIAELQDPVCATWLLRRLRLKHTTMYGSGFDAEDIDMFEELATRDPGVAVWHAGRKATVERYNANVDKVRNSFRSHARQTARHNLQVEVRHKIYDDIGILKSLRIGLRTKRLLRGGISAEVASLEQEDSFLKDLELIAQSETIPERLFQAALNSRPLDGTLAGSS